MSSGVKTLVMVVGILGAQALGLAVPSGCRLRNVTVWVFPKGRGVHF